MYMDAWCVVHNCGSVLIRDLQNAGAEPNAGCVCQRSRAKCRLRFAGSLVACAPRVLEGCLNLVLISGKCRWKGSKAIRNLLSRKLDPPDTFNERPETHTFHLPVGEVTVTLEDVSYILGLPINGEAVTGRSDSSHEFLVENCIACFGREPGPDDHVFGKVHIACVRQCRDSEPCDTQESLERYVRVHIFCVFRTIMFPNKSTVSLNSKFLPLLWDFHRISGYSWRATSLAHLYRSLCRASRYNCKEMDGPLILLFVWACERMPFLAPIPGDQLGDVGIPLARQYWLLSWNHWRRHTRYIRRSTTHFRRGLDDMGVDDFIWRPYMGVGIPDVLAPHLVLCSTRQTGLDDSLGCSSYHQAPRSTLVVITASG
ncbi:uncharacterized protein DS421_17g578830 [Arachis hypogaea]|nr:uncharacterized protein DS421_17g578830 [Arachis hypogaea]